jgi:hypothetical protein
MRPPTSFPATVITGLAVLGAGVAVGAYAGSVVQKQNGGLAQGTGMALGGAFGGLAVSFAGLLAGVFKSSWGEVGETAALLGFGAMTATATATAFGPGGVFGGPIGALTPAPAGGGSLNPAPTSGDVVTNGPSGGGGSF